MISREVRGLERAMDALSARFSADATNIANINTPHYAPERVNFEQTLADAIDAVPHGDGLAPVSAANDPLEAFQPTISVDPSHPMRIDGNGVSLEAEMSDLMKTAEKYNVLATQIAAQYRNFQFIADAK